MTRRCNQDRIPTIGIFWDVNCELVFKATTLSGIPAVGGIRDVDDDHYSFWENLKKSRRDLAVYSYDHFPRGRIVYRESDKKFIIYADRCLVKSKAFLTRLRKAFGLAPRQCVGMGDSHYQCHNCNPEFVPDSSVLGEP